MRNLVLVVHISLDGFVAGSKSELDDFPSGDENLGFVNELTRTADTSIMGRISFEMLDKHWPSAKDRPGATQEEIAYSNWYNAAQKIAVSRTLPDVQSGKTRVIRENLVDEVKSLKNKPGQDILIFGSPSVANILMQAELIDQYWIFVNPVTFGKGIPLFNNDTKKVKFKLAKTKQFANGEIALQYLLARK